MRRKWLLGIDGVTYGTHSLGPVLEWFNEPITRVCCEAAGCNYNDPRGLPYAQQGTVMLCKTVGGGLIKIRTDLVSNHPFEHNFVLQGTQGCCKISIFEGGVTSGRIWLKSLCSEPRWLDLEAVMAMDEYRQKYLPKVWQEMNDEAFHQSHWGTDFLIAQAFIESILGEGKHKLGIFQAMDITVPGQISQQSIVNGGHWIEVPDARKW